MRAPEFEEPPKWEEAPEERAPQGEGQKLVLVNVPKRRWWKVLFKIAGFLALTGLTAAVFGFFGAEAVFGSGLPDIPKVEDYRPPVLSEVYTSDGVLAGEFYNERRKVVPYDRVPKRLVQAFIASEDSDFFDHHGVDILGTMRAAVKTVFKKITGRGHVQGGSTLTQQTAKAVLISAEGYKSATAKNLKRKVREALLARRLERELTKEQILYLYLNNVYLGHHAYGVQAAAENYYRKDVKDLTLAEMALIAGLPQAPSKYSPFTNPDAARRRRSYVLGRMLAEGMISQKEHDDADASPIQVYPVEDVFHEFAPYFTEETRRDIVNRYGNPALLNDGLKVFTTMDSEKQRAAQEAVLWGLLAVDKRQGYRGALMHLDSKGEREAFVAKGKKAMGDEKVTPGHYYVGLVSDIARDDKSAEITIGSEKVLLPLLGMRWAHKINSNMYYKRSFIERVSTALKVGDVVIVRGVKNAKALVDDSESWSDPLAKDVPKDATLVRLTQEPELQSALVSIDPQRQYLVAMVGGYDFDANEYNRAFQACRQPGSGFKPITYSGAIEKMGWTEGTIIVDSPIVYDDPENQTRWKPENYESEFQGEVLLKTALVNSMNVPAIKTFIALARYLGNKNEVIGIQKIADWAHSLGYSTPINPDYSAALGSSCVIPYEHAQVYATFNRLGAKKPTYFIRKVEDRFGRTLEDHTAWDDPWASLQDRVAGGYARLYEKPVQVMSRETGFLITDLMRGVVREGTGVAARALGKPAAGKTGTTNDSFDAWFTGFTRDLVATAWVGYDHNVHPMGTYENGGRAALPIWLAYMMKALKGRDQPEFNPPPDVDVWQKRVDKKTGRLAVSGTPLRNTELLWFKRGTEPEDKATEPGGVGAENFLMAP